MSEMLLVALITIAKPLLIKYGTKAGEYLFEMIGAWFKAEFDHPKEVDRDGQLRSKHFNAFINEMNWRRKEEGKEELSEEEVNDIREGLCYFLQPKKWKKLQEDSDKWGIKVEDKS